MTKDLHSDYNILPNTVCRSYGDYIGNVDFRPTPRGRGFARRKNQCPNLMVLSSERFQDFGATRGRSLEVLIAQTISCRRRCCARSPSPIFGRPAPIFALGSSRSCTITMSTWCRSEEHTSELQS